MNPQTHQGRAIDQPIGHLRWIWPPLRSPPERTRRRPPRRGMVRGTLRKGAGLAWRYRHAKESARQQEGGQGASVQPQLTETVVFTGWPLGAAAASG